jgi:hypothetical protein
MPAQLENNNTQVTQTESVSLEQPWKALFDGAKTTTAAADTPELVNLAAENNVGGDGAPVSAYQREEFGSLSG